MSVTFAQRGVEGRRHTSTSGSRPSAAFDTVHTIDARGNIMLEVMKGYFALTDAAVRKVIWQSVTETADALERKGIGYSTLKPALVPQLGRSEIGLFFDRESIDSGWYGHAVHAKVIPLLDAKGSHSVLHGDLLGLPKQQSFIATALDVHLLPSGNPFTLVDSHQVYCVYVNNLSEAMSSTLHQALKSYRPYLGCADLTYASSFKAYLSTVLVAGYIVHRGFVLQPHEDDLPVTTDQNTLGYPFEDSGLRCRSMPGMHYSLLLSYKIERPVLPGFETDMTLSLAAISDFPADIATFDLDIDARKFEYLLSRKTGTMKRLGVLGAPKATLEELIIGKLRSTYVYNMSFAKEVNVAKFDMLLELEASDSGEPVRVGAGFEYMQRERRIRLITLF